MECCVAGVLRIFRESKVRFLRTREDGTIFQITMGVNTAQVTVWNRGPRARNAPEAGSVSEAMVQSIFALRAHLRAGRPRSQTST